MPDIVLAALNARYIHTSLGLRYLRAGMGELRERCMIREFTVQERPVDVAEELLALSPRIIGLGVYVWNATAALELVSLIKRIRPEVVVVLGGPEVSHEADRQEIVGLADHVIAGEADFAWPDLCRRILAGERIAGGVLAAPIPDLGGLSLPYDEYTDEDIAHRLVYVEASRGCPFECEFCLSSLDVPVRQFPTDAFLAAMDRLIARGARHFKFVDRTFNLHLPTSRSILEFFLGRSVPDLFLHFEMIPDRLPEGLRGLIGQFPPGALQFEVGVQTFDPAAAERISRRQDYGRLEDNFRWLRERTGVHVHADLIVGLPGESFESIAAGFDRLVALGPQEIQVGMLKRLRGAPIARHDVEWGMVYSAQPPYEILRHRLIDFSTMQRLRRFARLWDLLGNSGNFRETKALFWSDGGSPFRRVMAFSDWLRRRGMRLHAVALPRLMEHVFEFLAKEVGLDPARVADSLEGDWRDGGRGDPPPFLRHAAGVDSRKGAAAVRTAGGGSLPAEGGEHVEGGFRRHEQSPSPSIHSGRRSTNSRQRRHLGQG